MHIVHYVISAVQKILYTVLIIRQVTPNYFWTNNLQSPLFPQQTKLSLISWLIFYVYLSTSYVLVMPQLSPILLASYLSADMYNNQQCYIGKFLLEIVAINYASLSFRKRLNVEHPPRKRKVMGSNPSWSQIFLGYSLSTKFHNTFT